MEEIEHKSILISELSRGKDMAIQLRTHLHPSNCSSPAPCLFWTQMIHFSFEKALLLLNFTPNSNSNSNSLQIPMLEHEQEQHQSTKNKRKSSTTNKDKDVLKKRKLTTKWTEEVKVCSDTADLEGPLNDGYNWRKYGQKDIHNSNFPRCYYRCTHRHVRGCLATKQVQRSDTDPNIFEVKYRGRHTCNQSSNLGLISVSNQNEIPEETNQNQQIPNSVSENLFNFGEHQHFNVESEDFDNVFQLLADNSLSPAAGTAWDWSVYGGGCGGIQPSEQSDTTAEIIWATTSGTNSPIGNGDWSLPYDKIDFDDYFPFECLDFLNF